MSPLELWDKIKAYCEQNGVLLVKRGRQYFMRCPFHEETNPSLAITPELGLFKCFGAFCGAKGTLWRLAKLLGLYEDDYLTRVLREAWEHQKEGALYVYKTRLIPPEISVQYGVGALNTGDELTVVYPHPSVSDYHGYVSWGVKQGYKNSKGLSKTIPFGAFAVANGGPIYVVEGVFDCLSLKSIGVEAVASLGESNVTPYLHLFGQRLVLAPDNDKAGYGLLQHWINEIKELKAWHGIYVCRWGRVKDANDALRAGVLKQTVRRVMWLPVYVVWRGVRKYPETYRSALLPYLQSMPLVVREQALREATQLLQKEGLKVNLMDLKDIEPQEPVWLTVLRSALRDKNRATTLFNQPDFAIALLPDELKRLALEAFAMLEGLKPEAWAKSPYGDKVVLWAWQQAKAFVLEQTWRKLLATE